MHVELVTDLNAALVAAGDASATRTVYGVVIALGLIGLALVVLAIWLIKQTKPEPQLLAPLERMDDRKWRQQDPAQMRRDLDSLRPTGALPVVREPGVPDVDAEFAQSRPTLGSFDDLQAQLAADTRRTTTGGDDPLLPGLADPVENDRAEDDHAEDDRAEDDRADDDRAEDDRADDDRADDDRADDDRADDDVVAAGAPSGTASDDAPRHVSAPDVQAESMPSRDAVKAHARDSDDTADIEIVDFDRPPAPPDDD